MALACDFRIFAEGTRVGLIETRFGLLPDMGATVRLPRIIGEARARELILLGEIVDADEALRIGLANKVVSGHDLEAAAVELAERLAAQPPLAVRGARQAIDAAWHRSPQENFRRLSSPGSPPWLTGPTGASASGPRQRGARPGTGLPPAWSGRRPSGLPVPATC